MSVVESVAAAPRPAGATWTQVSPSLWVASTQWEFLGTVELIDGRYVAFDGLSLEVGSFEELDEAKREVLHPTTRSYEVRRSRLGDPDQDLKLARVTAWVAGIVIVASLTMVTMGLFA
jgi:hypothetical protein